MRQNDFKNKTCTKNVQQLFYPSKFYFGIKRDKTCDFTY